jgi:hypothetical protein
MSSVIKLDELDLNEEDRKRFNEILEEILPGSIPKPVEKLGFWKAMGKVYKFWLHNDTRDPVIHGIFQVYLLAIMLGSVLLILIASPLFDPKLSVSAFSLLAGTTTGLWSFWLIQALLWMYRSRQELATPPIQSFPTAPEIQRRTLAVKKRKIREARDMIVGENSPLSKKIGERKKKIDEALGIRDYFERRMQGSENHELRTTYQKAVETVEDCRQALAKLERDGENALELLRGMEASIPSEETALTDAEQATKLLVLRGETQEFVETSQAFVFSVVRDVLMEISALEKVYEQLMIPALAKLEGPNSVALLEKGVHDAVGRQTSNLRLVQEARDRFGTDE